MEIGQMHFLVADGDPLQRQSLVAILERLGAVHVAEAANGHAALRSFDGDIASDSGRIDLAAIDLALPGMDGLELIRHLAALKCRAGIVIVGAQGRDVLFSAESIARAHGALVLGAVPKPVTQQALAALIGCHLATQDGGGERAGAGARAARPALTFEEIGQGLQARQFEPFFQPMIELETGHVKALETFARWRHPHHGVLEPVDFMAPLEQRGRIDFLDWSMIEASVAGCRALHDLGIPIAISINLAPHTLLQSAFMTQMNACLAQHRILADYLTFELPESAVLSTDLLFLERLLRLRMQGFGLAIDDYGTGCTNLQSLARIPFSELKIDRGFVDGASKSPALATVLRTCLGLARSLDRRSVAVGVETEADWDFLQGMGCTYAQGYYIAKPMALGDFPAWLKDWRQFF
jgi:EAL domain-containing protein (putative c-di-GMP-specific phosphodiesterase class I)/FixJ family two-component response regulator